MCYTNQINTVKWSINSFVNGILQIYNCYTLGNVTIGTSMSEPKNQMPPPFLWPSVHPSFPHQLLHIIHPSVISLCIPPSSTHSCVSTEHAGIAFNLQAFIQNVLFTTLSQVTGCPRWRSLWFSSFSSDEYEHSTWTRHILNIPNPRTFTSLLFHSVLYRVFRNATSSILWLVYNLQISVKFYVSVSTFILHLK
jgi:hypothetical protein